ncbi:MAG: hypothetical protein RIQ87_653 [Chloroflexota bacterium]
MATDQLLPLAIAGLLVGILGTLLAVLALMQARGARQTLAGLLIDEEGSGGDGRLTKALHALRTHGDQLASAGERLEQLEAALPQAISRIGLIHFQAFEDVGGGQSSALALLDELGDGAVLTAIHSRAGTRVYVKQITAGRGEVTIGEEEGAAIAAALAAPRHGSAKR